MHENRPSFGVRRFLCLESLDSLTHSAYTWHMTKTAMAPADDKVLRDLVRARDAQQKVVESAQAALDSINRTIQQMTAEGGDMPASLEFANMGITEAATVMLKENPKGMNTGDMAREFKKRGGFSRSSNLVPTIYATLNNASADNPRATNHKFRRKGDLWLLYNGAKR